MKFLLLLIAPIVAVAEPVFLEKGGIVAIEAESTSSRLSKWKKKTDVADFSGECHLEFTGNRPESGPPESPLKYQFTIKKAGIYQLSLRARKRLETEREDISNDCFVSLAGDFEQAGKAPLKILKEPTKMYGGNKDSWGWTTNLDVNHKKFPAEYLLQSGKTYTLTIHGRSQNFNLDRILFAHEDVGIRQARKKNPKESELSGGIKSSQIISPTERELTNKKGQTVLAKLVSKDGDKLIVIIKGRSHDLKISELSQEDQEFIKEWQPK